MKTFKFQKLFLMLIIALSLLACKKDALTVDTEKRFVQERVVPATDLAGGSMSLTLKPGKRAEFNPGGDIVYTGSYDISGKKITVKIPDMDWKYRFTVVSDYEIRTEGGETLRLVEQ